jgi:hypothetical protein
MNWDEDVDLLPGKKASLFFVYFSRLSGVFAVGHETRQEGEQRSGDTRRGRGPFRCEEPPRSADKGAQDGRVGRRRDQIGKVESSRRVYCF